MPARGLATPARQGDEPSVTRPAHKQAPEQKSGKGQIDCLGPRAAAPLVGPASGGEPGEAAAVRRARPAFT